MDFSGWELTSVEKFPETCINARLRGTKGEDKYSNLSFVLVL